MFAARQSHGDADGPEDRIDVDDAQRRRHRLRQPFLRRVLRAHHPAAAVLHHVARRRTVRPRTDGRPGGRHSLPFKLAECWPIGRSKQRRLRLSRRRRFHACDRADALRRRVTIGRAPCGAVFEAQYEIRCSSTTRTRAWSTGRSASSALDTVGAVIVPPPRSA